MVNLQPIPSTEDECGGKDIPLNQPTNNTLHNPEHSKTEFVFRAIANIFDVIYNPVRECGCGMWWGAILAIAYLHCFGGIPVTLISATVYVMATSSAAVHIVSKYYLDQGRIERTCRRHRHYLKRIKDRNRKQLEELQDTSAGYIKTIGNLKQYRERVAAYFEELKRLRHENVSLKAHAKKTNRDLVFLQDDNSEKQNMIVKMESKVVERWKIIHKLQKELETSNAKLTEKSKTLSKLEEYAISLRGKVTRLSKNNKMERLDQARLLALNKRILDLKNVKEECEDLRKQVYGPENIESHSNHVCFPEDDELNIQKQQGEVTDIEKLFNQFKEALNENQALRKQAVHLKAQSATLEKLTLEANDLRQKVLEHDDMALELETLKEYKTLLENDLDDLDIQAKQISILQADCKKLKELASQFESLAIDPVDLQDSERSIETRWKNFEKLRSQLLVDHINTSSIMTSMDLLAEGASSTVQNSGINSQHTNPPYEHIDEAYGRNIWYLQKSITEMENEIIGLENDIQNTRIEKDATIRDLTEAKSQLDTKYQHLLKETEPYRCTVEDLRHKLEFSNEPVSGVRKLREWQKETDINRKNNEILFKELIGAQGKPERDISKEDAELKDSIEAIIQECAEAKRALDIAENVQLEVARENRETRKALEINLLSTKQELEMALEENKRFRDQADEDPRMINEFNTKYSRNLWGVGGGKGGGQVQVKKELFEKLGNERRH